MLLSLLCAAALSQADEHRSDARNSLIWNGGVLNPTVEAAVPSDESLPSHLSSALARGRQGKDRGATEATKSPQAKEYRRHGKDYALVIGVDTYPGGFPTLSNPIHDALKLKDTLEQTYNFNVRLLKNPKGSEILQALDDYRDSNKYQLTDDDQLLVFFGGHGLYIPELNLGYLLPSDSIRRVIVQKNSDGTIEQNANGTPVTFIPAELG